MCVRSGEVVFFPSLPPTADSCAATLSRSSQKRTYDRRLFYARDKNRKQETIVDVKYTEVVIFNWRYHTLEKHKNKTTTTKQKPKRKTTKIEH